jgi:6-phosphogluconolactonase
MARCRAVWFIASGEGKADAVARALAPDGTIEETPARGVRGDETIWWLDEPAASALPT